MPVLTSRERARELDAADSLARFRERFHLLPGKIYMDGNSLGLMPKDSETAILTALDQWKTLGIDGWMSADPSWFTLGERLGAMMAPLVGAEPDEVVVTGTTTVNQHALVATFYRPEGDRRKIVATELDFPSDIYALQSQILLHGGDPDRDLVRVPSRDGRTIDEADVIAAMTDDVALVLMPAVLYRSGQLLDIERIAAAARERGIVAGFDCAHSVGAVPHRFDEWDVDFAFWCSYKYLNSGPGSAGALYVNRKHFGERARPLRLVGLSEGKAVRHGPRVGRRARTRAPGRSAPPRSSTAPRCSARSAFSPKRASTRSAPSRSR